MPELTSAPDDNPALAYRCRRCEHVFVDDRLRPAGQIRARRRRRRPRGAAAAARRARAGARARAVRRRGLAAAEAFGIHAGMRHGGGAVALPGAGARAARSDRRRRGLGARAGAPGGARRGGRVAAPGRGLLRRERAAAAARRPARAAARRRPPRRPGDRRAPAPRAAPARGSGGADALLRDGRRPRRARPRPGRVAGAAELAARPVELLRRRAETAALVEPLERLGIATLGALAALSRAAVADRFGRPGLLAHDLARGRDTPLRPRRPGELLRESLELPEAGSGEQLGRALGLLIDRLLARRERRGRTLRAVVLAARLVEGGTWRERVVFREALADPERMRLALGGRLALLPAPAETLRLTVERFGPPAPGRARCSTTAPRARDERLREAVRQARAAAGPDAALRVLEVDPDSRVPERRVGAHAVGPVRPMSPGPRRLGEPRPAAVRADAGGRPLRRRRAGGRRRPRVLARRGPLVDRRGRCAGATGRSSRPAGATSSSSASWGRAAGTGSADGSRRARSLHSRAVP